MNAHAAIVHQRAYLRRIYARHEQAVAEKDADLAADLTYAASREEAELQRMLSALARSAARGLASSQPVPQSNLPCTPGLA